MNKRLFFTTPKAFTGASIEIQHNAFRSWRLLELTVLVLGDEAGVAEAARLHGFLHQPKLSHSRNGVPYVNDLFASAEHASDAPCLAYLNADIILTPAIAEAIERAHDHIIAHNENDLYLLTAQRATIDSYGLGDIPDDTYFSAIQQRMATGAAWDGLEAVDLFVYPKGLFEEIPNFAIGRTAWDNWLIWKARERGAKVVDLSSAGMLTHQFHGYHAGGGWETVWTGDDASRNIALAEGRLLDLGSARTHSWDGEHIVPWDEKSPALSWSDEQNIERRLDLTVRVARRALAHPESGLQEALGALQICLQTAGRYYSHWPAMGGNVTVESVLDTVARIGKEELDQATRLTAIEDLMATPLLNLLQKKIHDDGRPLVLWGAGGFARRLVRVLARHGFDRYSVTTSDDDRVGEIVNGGDVVASQSIDKTDSVMAGAFVVIATTDWRSVRRLLEHKGFQLGADIAG